MESNLFCVTFCLELGLFICCLITKNPKGYKFVNCKVPFYTESVIHKPRTEGSVPLHLNSNFSQHRDRRGISEQMGKQSNLRYLFEK